MYHGSHPGVIEVQGVNYRGDVRPRGEPPKVPKPDLLISADLGQLVDYTALSLVQRSIRLNDDGFPAKSTLGHPIRHHDVLAIKRFELGSPYTTIVRDIKKQADRFPGAKVIVDATGVGRPIVDLIRELRVECHAITITGGKDWSNPKPFEYRVSKYELVAAVRVALETEALKIAQLPDPMISALLRKELTGFKVTRSKTDAELYDAREGDHDDLVLAVALPVWYSYMMDNFQMFISGPAAKVDVSKPNSILGGIVTSLSGLFGQRGLPQSKSGIIGESPDGQRQPPSPGPFGPSGPSSVGGTGIFGDPNG